jgi:hypothetical protein
MKTTRIHCGAWSIDNTDVELATELFGPGGTQADRRWFYRLIDKPNTQWRGQRHLKSMDMLLYFRNSADAVFFALKKGG